MRTDQPRWLRGRRLRDDRGRIVPLQGPGRALVDSRVRRGGWRAVCAARRRDRAWRSAVVRGATAQAVVLLLLTSLMVWSVFIRQPPLWAGGLIVAAYGALAATAHLWLLGPEMGRQLIVFRTVAGTCPTCCYPLAGLAADPDGCTVCPECGAAWRLAEPPSPRPD